MSFKRPDPGRPRFARISDVPRIAAVATAGFYHSPVFAWERPYHSAYPNSTFLSYQASFAKQIRDPQYVVAVVEDFYNAEEDVHTGATIAASDDAKACTTTRHVIVGVASWKLKPGSIGQGQFMDSEDGWCQRRFEEGDAMDQDDGAVARLNKACEIREQRYFDEYMMLEMLVVHPAYWRRGHASNLLRRGNLLADMDRTSIGVVASSTAESTYRKIGFQKVDCIKVQNEGTGKNVYVGFWVRHPRQLWYNLVPVRRENVDCLRPN